MTKKSKRVLRLATTMIESDITDELTKQSFA